MRLFKAISLLLILSMASCGQKQFDPSKRTNIDVYLMAGQSNTVGYSPIKELDQTISNKQYNFLKFYATGERNDSKDKFDKWIDSSLCFGDIGLSRNYFGPEMGLVDSLKEHYENFPLSHEGKKDVL